MGATLSRRQGQVHGHCADCDERQAWPDKGLGRASAFAWLTRHQNHTHPPAPRLRVPEPESDQEA